MGGPETVRKLLGYGRRALRAKLWAFLPPCWCLVLAGVQHHPSSRSCRSCCSPAAATVFFIVIQISSSLRTASIPAESAPLEWGGSQLVSREDQHQPPPAQGGGGPACSLPDLSQLHTKFISITSDHNNCGSDHHQQHFYNSHNQYSGSSVHCYHNSLILLPQPSTAHERH